jgi:hypothetical protein
MSSPSEMVWNGETGMSAGTQFISGNYGVQRPKALFQTHAFPVPTSPEREHLYACSPRPATLLSGQVRVF